MVWFSLLPFSLFVKMHLHKDAGAPLLEFQVVWMPFEKHVNLPHGDIGMAAGIGAVNQFKPMLILQGIKLHGLCKHARRQLRMPGRNGH